MVSFEDSGYSHRFGLVPGVRGVSVWGDFFVSTHQETSKHCLLANLQPRPSFSSLFIVPHGGIISVIFQVFEPPFTSVWFKDAYRLMINYYVFSPYSTRYGSVLKWRDSPQKRPAKEVSLDKDNPKGMAKPPFFPTHLWFIPLV